MYASLDTLGERWNSVWHRWACPTAITVEEPQMCGFQCGLWGIIFLFFFPAWTMLLPDGMLTLVTIGKPQWVLHLVTIVHTQGLPAHLSIVFWGFILVCDHLLKADALKERCWAEKQRKHKKQFLHIDLFDSFKKWVLSSLSHWLWRKWPLICVFQSLVIHSKTTKKQNKTHATYNGSSCSVKFRTWTFNLIC